MAVTVLPVVELNPVDGVQVYVFAPFAVKVVDVPAHIIAGAIVMVGVPMDTVEDAIAEQPLTSVPVMV